jgi:hypothetical protein
MAKHKIFKNQKGKKVNRITYLYPKTGISKISNTMFGKFMAKRKF